MEEVLNIEISIIEIYLYFGAWNLLFYSYRLFFLVFRQTPVCFEYEFKIQNNLINPAGLKYYYLMDYH